MASVALVPRAEQDIRAALNVLALNFSLNDKVVEELLKVGVRNLEEFRFLFEDEAKVGAFVAKIGLGDEATIQTARLRRAWTVTRVYFSQVEQDRSKVALADLDSLLEESELRDAKQAFWRRYRLKFPAEVHPSDAVVSRVSRELSKRMLRHLPQQAAYAAYCILPGGLSAPLGGRRRHQGADLGGLTRLSVWKSRWT